jgi:hypothetical protein
MVLYFLEVFLCSMNLGYFVLVLKGEGLKLFWAVLDS